jgi:tetratricopeptide (TPR) repeat protein
VPKKLRVEVDIMKPSVKQTLPRAKSQEKKGALLDAQRLYDVTLNLFPQNRRAQKGFSTIKGSDLKPPARNPPQEVVNELLNLFAQGRFALMRDKSLALTLEYPKAFLIWNSLGVSEKGLGRTDEAFCAFKKATEENPTYVDGFYNMGVTLQNLGKLGSRLITRI